MEQQQKTQLLNHPLLLLLINGVPQLTTSSDGLKMQVFMLFHHRVLVPKCLYYVVSSLPVCKKGNRRAQQESYYCEKEGHKIQAMN